VLTEQEMHDTLDRIHPILDMKEAVENADLVIEAVPENPAIKTTVLEEADKYANEDALITSNTSSISITELASHTQRPEKFCGMHFFNPPQLMKLVEIIRGAKTLDETINMVVTVSQKMGKDTVVVKKDSAGFIVNRILVPALNEAFKLVWEGVATPEDIDKAIASLKLKRFSPCDAAGSCWFRYYLGNLGSFSSRTGRSKIQTLPVARANG